MEFDINLVMEKLRERKKEFVNENDLKQEMVNVIEDLYSNARTRMEYPTNFNANKAIDILVIINNKHFPIEVKYPTIKGEHPKNEQCYKYLQDIERIEKFRDNDPLFEKGYTIILTDIKSFKEKPTSENVDYYDFSIHERAEKTGTLMWQKGEKKRFEQPITLKGTYKMNWKEYSQLNNHIFIYLVNEIDK